MNAHTTSPEGTELSVNPPPRSELCKDNLGELFSDSYERCLQRADFVDQFYDNYIAANDVVAEKFAHADMNVQKAMLHASLHMIMALRSVSPEEAVKYFEGIGTTHNRHHHDITPELYDCWLSCLLETVRDCDKHYDADVDAAWRTMCADGIRIMKSMY